MVRSCSEGGAVATILANNLLYRGGLIASRTLTPTRGGLVDQFGSKIMDNRLTIKNYTAMKEYNGIPLYGYYEVDGEGVTPEAEMTLVEKGVFKKMLNGRTPTLQALETTVVLVLSYHHKVLPLRREPGPFTCR